jgi:hypothetical protein
MRRLGVMAGFLLVVFHYSDSSAGLAPQGWSAQGWSAQGWSAQGWSAQGWSAQGVFTAGTDLPGPEPRGVAIDHIAIVGTALADTTPRSAELTGLPGMSTGTGNYISVGGATAVGHYARARLLDGANAVLPDDEDLVLYVAGEERDPNPNLFHRPEEQDNEDMLYTIFALQKFSGQWVSLCPYDAHTKNASAMAIAEDPTHPDKFILACTASGVAAKCARNWGYRPWATTKTWAFDKDENAWVEKTIPLLPYYEACKVAARAAYCQDDKSFTKNGTQVDLFDTSQIIWANSVENPFSPLDDSSRWMVAQEFFVSTAPRISCASDSDCAVGARCAAGRCVDVGGDGFTCSQPFDCGSAANVAAANAANGPLRSALQRTRYRELSPQGAACAEYPFIDRLEHDHIEDGRWGVTSDRPDLHVFSPLSCRHNEQEEGEALPWDCSPCTTQVCAEMPSCCGRDRNKWTAECVTKTLSKPACLDENSNPVPGLVWPRDLTPGTDVARHKYLVGAGGAVLRVDGTGASAKLSGWACDPEWPTSTVMVEVFGGGPREQPGSVSLGKVRAELALASPLSREVARACDGPFDVAYHGFELPLGSWSGTGDVFVYAIDEATADGPAAPPTLLRNGIVHVPTAEPPPVGSAFTAVASGWLEAPLDGVYRFQAAAQPSRLWINGQQVLGWGPWPLAAGDSLPNTTEGQITLMKGARYHIRWDRLQTEPPADGTLLLGWATPGATLGGGLTYSPIPQDDLYQLAPGSGLGLSATYVNAQVDSNVAGGLAQTTSTRIDATVDINPQPAPPSEARLSLPFIDGWFAYGATWDGEIVPPTSGDYVFHVLSSASGIEPTLPMPTLTIGGTALPLESSPAITVGSSCERAENGGHHLCALGGKLNASCDPCVAKVCAKDSFCCDGGYPSYYSAEPVWDGKCIDELVEACPAIGCSVPGPDGASDYKFQKLTLQAGVHYPIHLYIYTSNFFGKPDGSDSTAQFLWEGPGMFKQLVPQFALYPSGQAPLGKGSGLNVTYFATKTDLGATTATTVAVVPDFDTPLAAGATPTVSASPVPGQLGTPLYEVLVPSSTPVPANGAPLPPPRVSPSTYGAEVVSASSGTTTPVTVTGTGVAGSVVTVRLDTSFLPHGGATTGRFSFQGGPTSVTTTVAADGTFSATIDVQNIYGTWGLRLLQAPPPNPPAGAPLMAASPEIFWPFLLVKSAVPPGTIQIDSPRDLTYSPVASETKLAVSGKGSPGLPLTVTDLAGNGGSATLTPGDLAAGADGTFQGTVELSVGWHQLVFHQAGAQSKIVFVAVGLQPPIVDFPRTGVDLGAALGCVPPPPTVGGATPPLVHDGWSGEISGTTAYSPDSFGKIYLGEETGRVALKRSFTPNSVVPTLGGDGLYHYAFSFADPAAPTAFGPGKHVLYVFQAPDPPAGATPTQVEAHLRGFASIAAATKLVVNVPPPRFAIPGGAGPLDCDCPDPALLPGVNLRNGSTDAVQTFTTYDGTDTNGNPYGGCTGAPDPSKPLCARAFADVNLKVGSGTYTARADANGNWTIADVARFAPGWTTLSLSQVVPSDAGGTWSTSCPTPPISVPVNSGAALELDVPGTITAPATSAAGAVVTFTVGPQSSHGIIGVIGGVSRGCAPSSGSTFPIGTTHVLCTASQVVTAIDLNDGSGVTSTPPNVTTKTFDVIVTRGAPVIHFPASLDADAAGVTRLEATGALGAEASYDVTATDFIDGPVAVTCAPSSPTLFPFGNSSLTCVATNSAKVMTTEARSILVADTTPPTLTLPAPITVTATSAGGVVVTFAATATDAVTSPVPVNCAPQSGLAFPVGTTNVNCSAADGASNSAQGSFTVTVLPPPNTPPVVTVPANMTVNAPGPAGIKATFTATASDAQDGPLMPNCTPASNTVFAIGTTTVNCSVTDSGGLPGSASFNVTVINANTAPVVTVPANLTVEAAAACGTKVTFQATATDAQDGALSPACTPASGTNFAIGTKLVTCTAKDSGGLTGSASFTVTVRDTKGPVFCGVPTTPVKAYATTTSGAKVSYYKPTANDAVDGARSVTCSLGSGAQFPINKTTVTCTASDKSGNTSTATFDVLVTYQAPTDGTFFLAPLRSNGSSIFKIGAPLGVRFKLTGATITNLVAKLSVTKLSTTIQGTNLDTSSETVADTGLTFKYDAAAKSYVYRWKTSDQTQGTFQLRADLGDGVVHQLNVSLKP